MNKIYSLIAVALSATTIMAQSVLPSVKTGILHPGKTHDIQTNISQPVLNTTGELTMQSLCKKNSAVKHTAMPKVVTRNGARALTDKQKYAGAYTSDTYNNEFGIGFSVVNMELGVLSYLSKSLLAKYDGSKIVGIRYALSNTVDVTRVMIYSHEANTYNTQTIASKVITSYPVIGWNTVMFSQPVNLDLSNLLGLFVGFNYMQTDDQLSNESSPLSFVKEGNTIAPVYLFGNLGQGLGLYQWGIENDYGNLSVQLIVENENFPTKDAIISGIATGGDWYKNGDEVNYAVAVSNFGTQTINELELSTYIDDALVATQTVNNVTETVQNISGTVTLPANLSLGQHILTVYASSADGSELTENTSDDALAIRIFTYDQTVERQKNLLEQFTSQYCVYCQDGATNLKNFVASRNNDIAWVAVHGDMQSGRDEFTITESNYIMNAEDVAGFPTASFNRTVIRGALALETSFDSSIAPGNITQYFNDIIDYTHKNPALATVNISGSYDEATRALEVKVSGKGVNTVELLANYGLTVYLTEDGIQAQQLNTDGETWNYDYVHDHVLRASLSAPLGTLINWTGDTYEMTFNTELDKNWDADNINIVAFVAPILNINEPDYLCEWVTNANSVPLKSIASGINGVYSNGSEAVEVARYNAAGQLISAPQKGINIIKLSNGKTQKVIMK